MLRRLSGGIASRSLGKQTYHTRNAERDNSVVSFLFYRDTGLFSLLSFLYFITGFMFGYRKRAHDECTNENIAELIVERANEAPNSFAPIADAVSGLMAEGGEPTFFKGKKAAGFFATAFMPTQQEVITHVICRRGAAVFYLINFKEDKRDDGNKRFIASLPSGLIHSGESKQLARAQFQEKMRAGFVSHSSSRSHREFLSGIRGNSIRFTPQPAQIDSSDLMAASRILREQTGLILIEKPTIINTVHVNQGARLISHALYTVRIDDSEQLPHLQKGNCWINPDKISSDVKTVEVNGHMMGITCEALTTEHIKLVLYSHCSVHYNPPPSVPREHSTTSYKPKCFGSN